MKNELISKIADWHEQDNHINIIQALLQIPVQDLNFELKGYLGRAYNNISEFDKALKVLLTEEVLGKNDSLWNYRVGFAYYYKNEFEMAFYYFNKSALLGDEAANTFKQWCFNEIQFKKWYRLTVDTIEFLSQHNGDWNLLSENRQELVALYLLEDEVTALGFLHFFSNWGYSCYVNAYKGLIRLGYPKCAQAIKKQFELINAMQYNRDANTILDIPTLLSISDQDKIKALDKVYKKNNEFLPEKVIAYFEDELLTKKMSDKKEKVNVLYLNLDLDTKH
ncbi:DMP19 family protein [Flavobacterium agricola]|uniref:DMP19 family protein n=1 Tax=Flavobacterium agricola TaxID=2870839 RepID=A0ABY6M3R9_9FLAO|nr:DMP19 family protein [Flavobacterium agricola]UYW01866.1 DMP19 family protein [Flavobacterium agricola]